MGPRSNSTANRDHPKRRSLTAVTCTADLGERAVAFPYPQRHARFEQRRRRLHEVRDLQKPGGQHGVPLRRAIEFLQVPVDEPYLSGSRTLDRGMLQIAADRDLPRHVDESARRLEEAAGYPLRAGREAVAQREGFHAGDRHALTIDRIEAAQRVAKREKTFGEAR